MGLKIKNEIFVKRYINIMIPCRDGIKLASDIYMPAGIGPFPAVLIRTPYMKSPAISPQYEKWGYYFAKKGFAYIVQDVRGRGDSEGSFYPFLNEGKDGYDSIEWISSQNWCTGKVGMDGNSYNAHVQYTAAKLKPPHLKAIAVSGSPGDFMTHGMSYLNGIKNFYMISWLMLTSGRTLQIPMEQYSLKQNDYEERNKAEVIMHLPLSEIPEELGYYSDYWIDTLKNKKDDEFYSGVKFLGEIDDIKIPGLHVSGWFDTSNAAVIDYYKEMSNNSLAKDDQYLIVGPWHHVLLVDPKKEVGPFVFNDESVIDIMAEKVKFYKKYLLDEDEFDVPKVRIYDMGSGIWANQGRLNNIANKEYLLDDGSLSEITIEENKQNKDKYKNYKYIEYEYNPNNPTPSYEAFCKYDVRPIAAIRRDIVKFSLVFKEDTILDGEAEVDLVISSDAEDTDIFVHLVVSMPSGEMIPITFNGGKLSYLEDIGLANVLPDGKRRIRLNLPYFKHSFKKNESLELHISSCSFPMFARGLNTLEDIEKGKEIKTARNKIYCYGEFASKIFLPIA